MQLLHSNPCGYLLIIRHLANNNYRTIRLDMAMKRKIGLENLQKFDHDQITIVITHKKPYDNDKTKIL